MNETNIDEAPPSFNTECWFLTLHAHHLSIIPAIQRYNKQARAIKELRRMVDDLTQTKSQWESTPNRAGNIQLLVRFKRQLKKLTKYVIFDAYR